MLLGRVARVEEIDAKRARWQRRRAVAGVHQQDEW